jgi:hypothetical protein
MLLNVIHFPMVFPQEFTPAFAHHCLGACERQHRTLAERLTTQVLKGKPWENELQLHKL